MFWHNDDEDENDDDDQDDEDDSGVIEESTTIKNQIEDKEGGTAENRNLFDFLRAAFQDVLRCHAAQRGGEPAAWVVKHFCQALEEEILKQEALFHQVERLKRLKERSIPRQQMPSRTTLKVLEQTMQRAKRDHQALSQALDVAREKLPVLQQVVALSEEFLRDPSFPPDHNQDKHSASSSEHASSIAGNHSSSLNTDSSSLIHDHPSPQSSSQFTDSSVEQSPGNLESNMFDLFPSSFFPGQVTSQDDQEESKSKKQRV